MDANKYEASKHQRQIVNRFNTFMQEGDKNFEKDIASRKQESSNVKEDAAEPLPSNDVEASTATVEVKKKQKKPPKNVASDLRTRIRSSEYLNSPEITSWKHRLKIKLEPSSFTEEKYALYFKYQTAIHHEPIHKCGSYNFRNFLVDSPLTATKMDNWTEEDPGFGSFHQCYYLDEELIAVSVIDILPECVSAVYFMYDPIYSVLSLGKYSAQREIALVQTLNTMAGYEDLKYYYMGFHIFSCPKMAYKAQFHPSYLLDPETLNWIEFKKCQEIIGDNRFSCFENPTPVNPLFEAKVRSIMDTKDGESESDSWETDEDDEEVQDNSNDEEQGGSEPKKLKLDVDQDVSDVSSKGKREKARKREMDSVFLETTVLPPIGCLDPEKITEYDLTGVLCLIQQALRPVVATEMYKARDRVREVVVEYYSFVGEEMANAMILYFR
ncbi:Arginyl-tRNA--protein transferase 1 [Mortierella sp. GBA43]|nr:Arginyl-tRNA--protein transferase 1 [Mortierella sp. GBA43]